MQALIASQGFGGSVSDPSVSDPEATTDPVRLQYHYKRPSYSEWENRRISPPLPPIGAPDLSAATQPTKPIAVGNLVNATYKSRVEMPKGFFVTVSPPVDVV